MSLKDRTRGNTPFFPNIFYKDLIVWLVVLGIMVTLAVLTPPGIGIKADPLAPAPENIKPEWYFLFLFQTLKLFPGTILGFNGETIAVTASSLAIFSFFSFLSLTENPVDRKPVVFSHGSAFFS
jgi:cytochrome b6